MNTLNVTSLKVTICAAAALMLTMAASYTFVDSNSVLRYAAVTSQMVAKNGTSHLATVAQATAGGLLQ
jgi:hypothetical protein